MACFTTAVGIVTGTADYFKDLFHNSQKSYVFTAVLGCVLGIVIGQLDFHSIIMIALPVLMFIYPITIVLILLNVAPEKYAFKLVFRAVVLVIFLFSIPDFLQFLVPVDSFEENKKYDPFGSIQFGMGIACSSSLLRREFAFKLWQNKVIFFLFIQ